MIRASIIGLGLVVLGFVWPASAQVKYTLVDLGTPGGGSSSANRADNSSQTPGGVLTADAATLQAFSAKVKANNLTDLSTLGGTNSSAQADPGTLGGNYSLVNAVDFDEHGQIANQSVGSSSVDGDTATHAMSWDANANAKDLGTLGGTNSSAFGSNCVQKVVGSSETAAETTDAFVWDSADGMQDLGTLGGSFGQSNAINCRGTIVGMSSLAGDAQIDAFLYADGTMRDLGNLGGSFSQANAINDSGDVVGSSNTTGDTDVHAFLWTPKGGLQDLNNLIPTDLGWDLNSANGINEAGKIFGVGTINGEGHAFALIPVDTED